VSVIVPNYNGRQHLERLLPSIADQTFLNYEVVIIDDCSPDRSVIDYLRAFIGAHGNMRLVENEENIGFVRTCNKGIRLSAAKYVCILTNDTEIQPNFLQECVSAMDKDDSIAVLSPIVTDKNGKIWFSGGRYKGGIPVKLTDDFQGIRPVDWVAGTAPFYRRDVFDKVGLLDESYFMYHEDVEFSFRVTRRIDRRVCMLGEKLVIHHEGFSLPRSQTYYYTTRNLFLLLRQYRRNRMYPVYLMNLVFLYVPRSIVLYVVLSVRQRSLKAFLASFRSLRMIRGAFDGLTKG
jgi:hypothetical protein